MPFPETPAFKLAHAVITFEHPLDRDPAAVEAILKEIRPAFPIVGPRQQLPAEAAPNIPHLIVQSTSAQVALSSLQADFEVRFYGGYEASADLVYEYVERKLTGLLNALLAVEARPVMIGLIVSCTFSLGVDAAHNPAQSALAEHLRTRFPTEAVNDIRTQVGLKVADHFYLSLALGTFESRSLMRPVLPGQQAMIVNPWEGTLNDTGVECTVDVNNRLRAVAEQRNTPVDEAELRRVIALSRQTTTSVALMYARDRELDLSVIEEVLS